MKKLFEFINEAAMVDLDPNLRVAVNFKVTPNIYTVIYKDKRGKEYEAEVDDDDFDNHRYAEEVVSIMSGSAHKIQKPWQDKLIKWVKQFPKNK